MGCGVSKSDAEKGRVATPVKVKDVRRNSTGKGSTGVQPAPARKVAVANGSGAAASKSSQAVANGFSSEKKGKENLTFKEWLDSAFPASYGNGVEITQEPLPDYYTEWKREFDNIDVTHDQLSQAVTLTKKAHAADGNKTKVVIWPYKKLKVGTYSLTPEAQAIDVRIPPGSKKRRIVVIGNCYIGSSACTERTLASLAGHLQQLIATAATDMHSVVLLGNIFDSRIDRFDVLPSTNEQLEAKWRQLGSEVCALLQRLASECDVSLYYVRGAHDADVSRAAVERLLGPSAVVVSGNDLVYVVHEPSETYTIRFSSGQEYDILESSLINSSSGGGGDDGGELLLRKPISHYLYRAAAGSPAAAATAGAGSGYTPSSAVRSFLDDVPRNVNEKMIGLLSTRTAQRMITAHLLAHAIGARNSRDVEKLKFVVEDGKFVSAETIFNYPYLKYKLSKWQPGEMAGALQANGGDYNTVAKRCQEDVVIYGHANAYSIGRCRSGSGRDVIYAVLGGCSERAESLTVLSLVAPRLGFNGKVEIICDTDSFSSSDVEADPSSSEDHHKKEDDAGENNGHSTEIRVETVD